MTRNDESVQTDREVPTFNTYQSAASRRQNGVYEESPLMSYKNHQGNSPGRQQRGLLRHASMMNHFLPSERSNSNQPPSLRRLIFLVITEPETSVLSAVFYFLLMSAIFACNIIMVMQTMAAWQYTPSNCITCGGNVTYFFEDDDNVNSTYAESPHCVCPPEPQRFTLQALRYLMNFFAVEWIVRVLMYVPENPDPNLLRQALQWLGYLTSPSTLIDALAIFPYYLENLPTSFVSLRLLRISRIFQLVRLGQYNTLFVTLTNVMAKSLNYLRLLILILAFGGAFFGSMIYWLEKGTWQYHEASGTFLFVRLAADGYTLEPTPFRSIPEAFWWFMVTATTVGYGDYYPTSTGGKWVACCAMLMGVLVIAFPVSVFSDLWSHELKQVKGFEDLNNEDDNDDDNGVALFSTRSETKEEETDLAIHEETVLLRRQHASAGTYNTHLRGGDSSVVIMDKEDLKELVACVYNIKENQRQLQSILRKYRLFDEDGNRGSF